MNYFVCFALLCVASVAKTMPLLHFIDLSFICFQVMCPKRPHLFAGGALILLCQQAMVRVCLIGFDAKKHQSTHPPILSSTLPGQAVGSSSSISSPHSEPTHQP